MAELALNSCERESFMRPGLADSHQKCGRTSEIGINKKTLKRHKKGKVRIVSVIGSKCLWKETTYAKLEVLPKNGMSIREIPGPIDQACATVAEELAGIVKDMVKQRKRQRLSSFMVNLFLITVVGIGVLYSLNLVPDWALKTMDKWIDVSVASVNELFNI